MAAPNHPQETSRKRIGDTEQHNIGGRAPFPGITSKEPVTFDQDSVPDLALCLKSLAFPQMQNRVHGNERATTGTCAWLLRHETYITWATCDRGLLCIKGKPGSGKSTLLEYALNNCEAGHNGIVLSFFFSSRGNELQRNPVGLFRSLIHQILRQAPDVLNLVDTSEIRRKGIGKRGGKRQWRLEELYDFFESYISIVLKTLPVWLFIDALDESGRDNALMLVQKLKSLLRSPLLESAGLEQFRICFTCRLYPILDLDNTFEICLEEENSADISAYVNNQFTLFHEAISSKIPALIIDRSSGVFLWASLVVLQVLDLYRDGASPNEIQAAVQSVPSRLDELIIHLIQGMGSTSLKLMQWICFATRPLSLDELRWAMVIDADCPYRSLQSCQRAEDYVSDSAEMKRRVLRLSCGLAETIPSSQGQFVQFIHSSVKRLFIEQGLSALEGSVTSIDKAVGMAQFRLSMSCIRYLAMEEIGQSTSYTTNVFPLISYATTSWVAHTMQSHARGISQDDLLDYFPSMSNSLVELWARVYGMIDPSSDACPPRGTSLVHVASRYQILGMLETILQRPDQTTLPIDTKDETGRTPLSWAAENGHEAAVTLLLSAGQVEADAKDNSGRTPLSWAAGSGHEAVVKTLLYTDQVKVNVRDNSGRTPLSWAAESGYEPVVLLLLSTPQVKIDERDNSGRTPLSWAAERGHVAVVKLLLSTGQVEVDARDNFGRMPLSWAAESGHEAVIKLLLSTGQVKVDEGDNYGRTPLSLAAESSHEAVVNLLLSTDQVKVDENDEPGRMPLTLAAERGQEALVNLLLSTGQVKVDEDDEPGRMPLSLAAECGHEAVDMLLDPATESTRDQSDIRSGAGITRITASRSSRLSRGIWSSEYAEETGTASMTRTSVDLGKEEKEQGPDDTMSIYTSDVPESSGYMQELATSFFKGCAELPDAESLERVLRILPDLLRGFALRIGGEQEAPAHFEVMKFLHQKRRRIAAHFEEYYLREKDDSKSLLQHAPDSMPLTEKVGNWDLESATDDPNSATPQPPLDALFLDDDGQSDVDEAIVDDFRPSKYRDIVTKSIAFQWLLCRVYREVSLTSFESDTMHAIATRIRQVLYSQPENCSISSTRQPPRCSMVFKSDWDPIAFVREQEYIEEAEYALERAIVIIQGANGDTEAITCSEYLNRTWPLFGEDFISLVKSAVRSKPGLRFSVTLFDKTKLTAWLEPSGCFALEAAGLVETIVEAGEVYGWIITALRSAPGDIVTSAMPILDIDAKSHGPAVVRANFCLQHTDCPPRSVSQCWQDLFRNPVVVIGFPVRRRQPEQKQGLEMSLTMMAALLSARRIAVICGDTVHWHVLFNEDGSRISFTDPRVRQVVEDFDLSKHLTLSGIENARHIVGWCRHVKNYAGSKDASYDIRITGLQKPGSGFAFDRLSISCGKFINVGTSVAVGTKDKPGRASKTSNYHKQLEWAEDRFVVLYDWEDRRAWLIDGLSAILHLVRAHIAHRRSLGREVKFKNENIKEPEIPHTGKRAARDVLWEPANMNLEIYERWNRPVQETTVKEDGPPETIQKIQTSCEHLADLVGEIYTTLGILSDIQMDERTRDGFGFKVHKSSRRHLEGWEFKDVATGADPLWPKAALLHDVGLGWVDLVRATNAIILFGVGFGEIFQPADAAQVFSLRGDDASARPALTANPRQVGTRCVQWATLPKRKDLLATTTPVIEDLWRDVYRPSGGQEHLRQLFKDIYWHSPCMPFDDCYCGAELKGTRCDRVQVLLPTTFPKLLTRGFRTPCEPLPDNGAVVFGHSVKFPLVWKSEAESIPTEGSPAPPQPTSPTSHQSDSGIGASIASSSVRGDALSRQPSLRPAGSGSPHGEAASNLDRTTTTSGSRKGDENIFKRLLGKIRPSAKPGQSL